VLTYFLFFSHFEADKSNSLFKKLCVEKAAENERETAYLGGDQRIHKPRRDEISLAEHILGAI
jgi:hypothetical protein